MQSKHTDAFNAILKSKEKPKEKPVFNKPTGLNPDHPLYESLSKCTVGDNCVFLPPISDGVLPDYAEIRKALINAGGKYNKNKFEFPNDPMPYLLRITGGEKVNIKKEFQFFPTPKALAERMAELADLRSGDLVLEPSAGQGAIVNAIIDNTKWRTGGIVIVELMPENCDVMRARGLFVHNEDFLKWEDARSFDKIIANPPFSRNQDIDHIREMYHRLKSGGRIVTIASRHWLEANGKKETAFREWLQIVDAEISMIDSGEFKESGTMVPTTLIVIDKK